MISALQIEDASFHFIFLGDGYTEGQDTSKGKPNGKIRTEVKGPGTALVVLVQMKSLFNSSISILCVLFSRARIRHHTNRYGSGSHYYVE